MKGHIENRIETVKEMKQEAEKTVSSDLMEGMTSISAVINSSDINDRKIEKIWIDREKRKSKAAEIGFLKANAQRLGYTMEFVDAAEIQALTVGNTHGGIIAFCSARTLPPLSELTPKEKGFYTYMEGIEDPYNFGYAIRSLYASGVDGIIVPERNWMGAAGVVARSSAGTSELIPIYTADADTAVTFFRGHGIRILCAGIRDSVSIFDEHFPFPLLLVIGGEKRGISAHLLEQADQIVRIDYGRSFRGSLSAASAATVMAFELYRQNRRTNAVDISDDVIE
jgi:23S rRNA (guanosine2251-2'-O)-methyltransferase